MLNPAEIDVSTLGELRTKALKQTKIELRMNFPPLEMLKGNTALEDLADLRERWVEPIKNRSPFRKGTTSDKLMVRTSSKVAKYL